MRNIFNKNMLKTWIVIAIALIIAIVGILIMPDTIPTHFGPSGEPDAWGTKFTVLMYPGSLLLIALLAEPMKKVDPKLENYERFNKYYYNFFFGFAIFFLVVEIANIAIALGASINVGSIICFTVGVLMFFVGNMMPKIKQNFFFGIKTPWALSDEENWFKTHRLGGKTFALGGIVMMICAFIPGEGKIWGLLVAIIVMTIIPLVYSFIIFKRKNNAK